MDSMHLTLMLRPFMAAKLQVINTLISLIVTSIDILSGALQSMVPLTIERNAAQASAEHHMRAGIIKEQHIHEIQGRLDQQANDARCYKQQFELETQRRQDLERELGAFQNKLYAFLNDSEGTSLFCSSDLAKDCTGLRYIPLPDTDDSELVDQSELITQYASENDRLKQDLEVFIDQSELITEYRFESSRLKQDLEAAIDQSELITQYASENDRLKQDLETAIDQSDRLKQDLEVFVDQSELITKYASEKQHLEAVIDASATGWAKEVEEHHQTKAEFENFKFTIVSKNEEAGVTACSPGPEASKPTIENVISSTSPFPGPPMTPSNGADLLGPSNGNGHPQGVSFVPKPTLQLQQGVISSKTSGSISTATTAVFHVEADQIQPAKPEEAAATTHENGESGNKVASEVLEVGSKNPASKGDVGTPALPDAALVTSEGSPASTHPVSNSEREPLTGQRLRKALYSAKKTRLRKEQARLAHALEAFEAPVEETASVSPTSLQPPSPSTEPLSSDVHEEQTSSSPLKESVLSDLLEEQGLSSPSMKPSSSDFYKEKPHSSPIEVEEKPAPVQVVNRSLSMPEPGRESPEEVPAPPSVQPMLASSDGGQYPPKMERNHDQAIPAPSSRFVQPQNQSPQKPPVQTLTSQHQHQAKLRPTPPGFILPASDPTMNQPQSRPSAASDQPPPSPSPALNQPQSMSTSAMDEKQQYTRPTPPAFIKQPAEDKSKQTQPAPVPATLQQQPYIGPTPSASIKQADDNASKPPQPTPASAIRQQQPYARPTPPAFITKPTEETSGQMHPGSAPAAAIRQAQQHPQQSYTRPTPPTFITHLAGNAPQPMPVTTPAPVPTFVQPAPPSARGHGNYAHHRGGQRGRGYGGNHNNNNNNNNSGRGGGGGGGGGRRQYRELTGFAAELKRQAEEKERAALEKK